MKKLKNIKSLLSREEMRQIQGGGSGTGQCGTIFQQCLGFTCCPGLRCSMGGNGIVSFCVTA